VTTERVRRRVVVVDDDNVARETISVLLSTLDCEVAAESDPISFLERAPSLAPDVVVLDVMMPGMDGFEVCKRLQADSRLRHVPIIMLTSAADKNTLVRALEAGATDFLAKPVSGVELRARVRAMLRLKEQHDEIERLLEMREDLTRMLVHDMRSPLTSLSLNLSTLRVEVPDTSVTDLFDDMQSAVTRLESMVDEVLLTARLESGKVSLQRDELDMGAIAQRVVQPHRASAEGRRVGLEVDVRGRVLGMADPQLLLRAVDNLVGNALKFCQPGGVVRVRVEPTTLEPGAREAVRFAVSDDGPGIPEDFRSSLFQKYSVLDQRRIGVKQTGLGLAFCRMVAEAHGGRILFEPNEPRGSRFVLDLPTGSRSGSSEPPRST
jgi:two-component system sensor histidine kinase/response regulator